MRKLYILSFFFLISAFTLQANDLYWFGGSGEWNDPSHWSISSGGAASFQLPNESTDVYIDQESLDDEDVITVSDDISIRSIVFDNKKAFVLSVDNGYK